MVKFARLLGLITVVACAATAWPQDLIIESRAQGQNSDKYKELKGSWTDSNTLGYAKSTAPGLTPGEKCGSRKVIVPSQEAGQARFSPGFAANGHYHVYVTWPKAANAAGVVYTVKHAKGEEKKTLNQNGWGFTEPSNAGKWVFIGDFDFDAGAEQYVDFIIEPSVKPADSNQLGQAYADAVMFAAKPVVETAAPAATPTPAPTATPATASAATPTPASVSTAPGTSSGGTPAGTLIIESRAEGKNSELYSETEGSWMNSSGKSRAPDLSDPSTCGSRKALVSGGSDGITRNLTAAARFSPKFKAPGTYHVYVTWPREGNGSPVHYIIKHAKGSETKVIKQDGWGGQGAANGNQWWLLGSYEFAAGDDQYIEIRTLGADTVGPAVSSIASVFADAVQFTQQPLQDVGLTPIAAPIMTGAPASTPPPYAGTAATAQVTGPLTWETDIEKASEIAARQYKKILIFFFAPESANSKYFDTDVFTNQAVKNILGNSFVLVRLNFVENTQLAFKLGIFKAGTLVIYDNKGTPLDKIDVRKAPEEIANRLRNL